MKVDDDIKDLLNFVSFAVMIICVLIIIFGATVAIGNWIYYGDPIMSDNDIKLHFIRECLEQLEMTREECAIAAGSR